ncbi:MAG: D-alanine--D-alanine ligase [Acetobacteraceae bacterium]|nr:D-alanine--D-alanine ligase [Acetobacteraceae bacterium]
MGKLRVGVIFGGRSPEHEVSLLSAASVLRAIDRERFEVVPIGITREGKWLLTGDPMRVLAEGVVKDKGPRLALLADPEGRALVRLDQASEGRAPAEGGTGCGEGAAFERLDVIFPVLHGPYGEDGCVQGLLELAGIPYVGAGVLASAVGMDKAVMKALFVQRGLPVARHRVVLRSEVEAGEEGLVALLEREFGYPCFTKPAGMGSSVGVTKAHDREELRRGLAEACRYDRKVLVEEAISGRELECSVLGNRQPLASAVGEIVPGREFYDYRAKYRDEGTQLLVPAPIPERVASRVQELAVAAFLAIDCSGMARVDFFYRPQDEAVLVNEINTIPGFTAISMYPRLWAEAGLSMKELVTRLIELALERHADRARSLSVFQPPP